jgi:transcriptional regulator with XRE-family HTH domain
MARWIEYYDNESAYRIELAGRLRDVMAERKLTAARLGRMAGLAKHTVGKLLRAETTPRGKTILRLETALKTKLSTIPEHLSVPIYKIKFWTDVERSPERNQLPNSDQT